MFRQVKSALFWYYLYKFRRKILMITFLLIVALFANAIYSDVVQYLTLKNKLEYLEIALALKWIIIVLNILLSVYIFLTFFKIKKDEEKKEKEKKKTTIFNQEKSENSSSKFTKREEKFLHKELNSKADLLVKR